MKNYKIIKIREHPEFAPQAADWFHKKWNIPKSAYSESISECLKRNSDIPQWYIVLCKEKIIAGIGVIENDFHERKDLKPNICAVYVEHIYRNHGIAGKMLQFVCDDFHTKGIDTMYLVTDHTSFYEKYGWEFICMTKCNGEKELSRMYKHIYHK